LSGHGIERCGGTLASSAAPAEQPEVASGPPAFASDRRELYAITVSNDRGSTIITLDGTLDSDAASSVRDMLRAAVAPEDAQGPIFIDLSRAREITPIGLAALVDESEALHPVRFLGLSQHTFRILEYLTSDRSGVPHASRR
jgi:anti-anti-sigma regulatory factor